MVARPSLIYQTIFASFCTLVVLSNLLSAKMTELPLLNLQIPVGLLTYPLTFLLSDLVTEIYGSKRAKLMVYIALAMSLFSLVLYQFGLWLPTNNLEEQKAFQAVLGASSLRIFSSLVAYIISQIIDINLYAAIKKWTGPQMLWLRNNGSTCISQFIDTIIVDLIFLWWGLQMPLAVVIPIIAFSYLYKAFFSIATTPLFYLLVFALRGKTRKFNPQQESL